MGEMHEHVTNDEIQRLIKKSVSGKRDWRVLAKIILEYEREKLWKGEASSFSAWLKQYADQLGAHISNLWRFRRAAKAAFMLWGDQGQRRISSLMDIPDGVSPESIEILEKISRAAPSYTVRDLATRLFEKTISMNELRMLWRKFRPALKGDARGRNKMAPRLFRGDARRRGKLFQNLVVESLEKLDIEVLGYGKDTPKKVLTDVKVIGGQFKIDVVMIIGTGTGDVEIHGIEVVERMTSVKVKAIEHLKCYCDYVWGALAEKPTNDIFDSIDTGIGLFHVRELNAEILRKAKKNVSELAGITARSVINTLVR